jgi:hypothetical protein
MVHSRCCNQRPSAQGGGSAAQPRRVLDGGCLSAFRKHRVSLQANRRTRKQQSTISKARDKTRHTHYVWFARQTSTHLSEQSASSKGNENKEQSCSTMEESRSVHKKVGGCTHAGNCAGEWCGSQSPSAFHPFCASVNQHELRKRKFVFDQ